MPYGLVSALCFFSPQAFLRDVLRNMLGKFIIDYIDDILIYSNSLSQHIQNIKKDITITQAEEPRFKSPNLDFQDVRQKGVVTDTKSKQ